MSRRDPMSKSLAVLGTAVASALILSLVLSTAPLLGQRGTTAQASTRCTGGGGEGTPTPTPTATETGGPLPTGILTILPTGSGSPSATPTGTASPTGTPTATSAQLPEPAQTSPTPTGTGTPTASPTEPGPGTTRRCNSEVTIDHNVDRQVFKGVVRSGEASCERAREVMLKRDKKGRDRTVEVTTTNAKGKWKAAFPTPRGGKFYASVPRSTKTSGGEDVVCNPARSRSIRAQRPR